MEKLTHKPKRIIAAVTNDLYQDQRMHRICTSLQKAGYEVELVGRGRWHEGYIPPGERIYTPLDGESRGAGSQSAAGQMQGQSYRHRRLRCLFQKGKLFYIEYNLRLWRYLLFTRFDAVCAVDTDTLPACFAAARMKGKPCVLDAHEYFSEVPELAGRPLEKAVWEGIAALLIPRLRFCYTVGETLANALTQRYRVRFEVIRNLPLRRDNPEDIPHPGSPFTILYQGMLNAGRGIAEMLEAMAKLDNAQLWIAGKGDLEIQLRHQAEPLVRSGKVVFHGFLPAEALHGLGCRADLGINLLEDKGLSYRYSLANKALDYIQAGLPSLQMDFPEYRQLNEQYAVFICLEKLDADSIADAVKYLQYDPGRYQILRNNCIAAASELHWGAEEPRLLDLYRRVFSETA